MRSLLQIAEGRNSNHRDKNKTKQKTLKNSAGDKPFIPAQW
jgi:hypothetical protein